jgi:hypothetical protein
MHGFRSRARDGREIENVKLENLTAASDGVMLNGARDALSRVIENRN